MDIIYSKQPEAFISKQTEQQAARIKKAINALPAGDIKKVAGYKGIYRLRVGNVRILFEKTNTEIHVIEINNRGQVYK